MNNENLISKLRHKAFIASSALNELLYLTESFINNPTEDRVKEVGQQHEATWALLFEFQNFMQEVITISAVTSDKEDTGEVLEIKEGKVYLAKKYKNIE